MPYAKYQGQKKSNARQVVTKRSWGKFIFLFVIFFVTWIILSGKFDAFHLTLGVISCLLVSFYSGDLILKSDHQQGLFQKWLRFIGYIPWLLYQVLLANIHLLHLVFHPRLMEKIDPRIIRFKSHLTSDMALLSFANSITLTPGTITVYVSIYGDFTVHAIDRPSAEALPGHMQERIAKVFDE